MFERSCLEAMKAHAIEQYPRESVGMVVAGVYHRITNEATEPDVVQFDERYALRHGNQLQALIHSHPGDFACPSYQDQVSQLAWGIPWGIVVCNEQKAQEPFFWGDGSPRPHYLASVGFRWVVQDCYAKIRDAFWQARAIRLMDFAREWGAWKARDGKPAFSGYDHHYREAGFERIDSQPREWDLAVMRLGEFAVTSHAGILLPGNMILHHLGNADEPVDPTRLSAREPIGRWLRCVKNGGYWLRYKGS